MKLKNKNDGRVREFGIEENGRTTSKFVIVCHNCNTPIRKGDIYCKQCNKLLVRQIFGGKE